MSHSSTRVAGLISDTHGLLRAGVHDALSGVDLILHAGDVGGAEILEELRLIAPVKAVFGNTDAPDDPELTQEILMNIEGLTVHVSHGHEVGSPTPAKLSTHYPADVGVYGHKHQKLGAQLDGRLFVNPGAAGPRRFGLTASVARLTIEGGKAEVEIIGIA